MIEKLVPAEGGGFIDPNGVHWYSKSNYLMVGILPSCGCGDPESIGRYVKEMLLKYVKQTNNNDYSCWGNVDDKDLPVMFFLSWATREGYIEHGLTIRYSRMTDKGNELLRDLTEVENGRLY